MNSLHKSVYTVPFLKTFVFSGMDRTDMPKKIKIGPWTELQGIKNIRTFVYIAIDKDSK